MSNLEQCQTLYAGQLIRKLQEDNESLQLDKGIAEAEIESLSEQIVPILEERDKLKEENEKCLKLFKWLRREEHMHDNAVDFVDALIKELEGKS